MTFCSNINYVIKFIRKIPEVTGNHQLLLQNFPFEDMLGHQAESAIKLTIKTKTLMSQSELMCLAFKKMGIRLLPHTKKRGGLRGGKHTHKDMGHDEHIQTLKKRIQIRKEGRKRRIQIICSRSPKTDS